MSTFFPNSRNFSIDGGTFSGINGDQHNYYYERTFQASHLSTSPSGSITQETSSRAVTTTVHINGNQINNQIIQREEKELTIYDDFRNLKRGDICRLRNICQVRGDGGCRCEMCCQRVMKMICAAKVNGVEGEFTVVSYSGRDARKVFEEEFQNLSRQLFSEVAQVYAIDKGTIPSMVLWHGLVPLVHVLSNVGHLGRRYLKRLKIQWECDYEEMWMDPTRGVVCRGPKGPSSYIPISALRFKDLPSTAELLQEEVLVRFLASHKSKEADDAFMYAMFYASNDEGVPEHVDRPTVFSTRTKTPIAAAKNVWESCGDGLVERTCLENGCRRFQLDGDGTVLLRLNWDVQEAWLSQAWRVFHARGVLLEDDREGFTLVFPHAWLDSYLDESPSKCQLRRQQPIFLFIYPPPPDLLDGNTSSLHHWSLHEDGQPQLSPELCCDLGLPVELRVGYGNYYSHSRSTSNYPLIHQYQLLRGFDPTTTDFARHLGYNGNIFQPLNDNNLFREVGEDQSSGPSTIRTDPGTSVTSADPEGPSDTQDLVSPSGQLHLRDSDFITHLHHAVAHKRQENHVRMETLNHADQARRHTSDTICSREPTSNTQALSPITPHLVRDLLSSRSFTPISFISRGLNTSCPPHSSVGVLSSSLSNNTTTGTLRLFIPANRPPTSQRNQRRLDETNEVAASITLAQQKDGKANRSR
ncbi:hypothetical protein PM082_014789 [Marasmius tenuissimus]|nr:hypothetical protein PM082_014789 [Marasmius tenuissimus]